MLNVGELNEGFVLDHIEAGKAMMIYNYLGLDKLDCQVAIIKNARSGKMGKKDIIKIEGGLDLVDLDVLGFVANQIDYINAHGTSTPMNDKLETAAIKKAFKNHAHKVAVSSTKGNTGHCLGAAGGIEGVLCVKALEDNFIPATINYQNFDEECDLDIVANHGRKQVLNYVMSNSLGFGGHNASIIFKKYGEE